MRHLYLANKVLLLLLLSLQYFCESYCVILCSLMAFDCQEIKGLLTYLLTYLLRA